MSDQSQLKGFEIENKSLKVVDKDLVGGMDLVHVGKIGSLKIHLEGKFELMPLLEKGIDKLEEIIPGDQTGIANALKSAIRLIKF